MAEEYSPLEGHSGEHSRHLCNSANPFCDCDGIVAMEGNGPLNGTPRPFGKIVLADDPVAADATCARLMEFEPNRIVHVNEGAKFLGNASLSLIDQVGEVINAPATPFYVVPEFRCLYAY